MEKVYGTAIRPKNYIAINKAAHLLVHAKTVYFKHFTKLTSIMEISK